MGMALAAEALRRGARVDLVLGAHQVPPPPGARVIEAESAEDMADRLRDAVPGADALIMAAAIADYKPRKVGKTKAAKSGRGLKLSLDRTPDILSGLSRGPSRPTLVVGFSAETGSLLPKARAKLRGKNADLIVANRVGKPGIGFGEGALAEGYLVGRKGRARPFRKISKDRLAGLVLAEMERLLGARRPKAGRSGPSREA